MAFKSKSGKEFSNRPMAAQQDKRDAAGMSQMGKTQSTSGIKNADSIHGEGNSNGDESQDPSSVVSEHGPADKVMVSRENGKHVVKSEHADGHKHKSVHASADEAHDAARQLSGSDDESIGDESDTNSSPNGMEAMGV